MCKFLGLAVFCFSLFSFNLYSEDSMNISQIPPRPRFNKNEYAGTVWSQANPWWLPAKSRINGVGGPDYAWHKYPDDPVLMWKKVAEICAPYGMTGLQMEMTQMKDKAGYIDVFKNMLEGFRLASNGFKGMVFLTPSSYKNSNNPELMKMMFRDLLPLISRHPNAYRIDGKPVIVVYRPDVFTFEEWYSVIREVENACGPMIWLADANNKSQEWVKTCMKVFDGISIYANWDLNSQRKFVDEVAPMMKKDFPEKIFEFGPHNTYCVHYHYGGISPKLTEKFVKSWEMTLEAKPDSIVMTNFFDCYENSRILPSYELDDILLKMSEYYICLWKKTPVPENKELSLYVANYTNVIIGSDSLFEIIGFPFKSQNRTISVQLEICDAGGKILHSFPRQEMVLDSMRILKYSLPTLPYADQRALFPRLKYTLNGKDALATAYPATTLVTSLRPHLLMWCRSIANMIQTGGGSDWTLNGVHPGQISPYRDGGVAVINSNSTCIGGYAPNLGGGHVRLLRNSREINSFDNWDLRFNRIFRLPDPGNTIDAYNLELENDKGGRYISPTIWVSGKTRDYKCSLPILMPDNKITELEIDAERVPFFYYTCNNDDGTLLVDSSGYDHHGILGVEGYGGGHLQRTAYRHEHLDGSEPLLSEKAPSFKRDEDGKGFLHFHDGRYVIIMGGTAFPYSFTYELSIRPYSFGKKQGIVGTGNGQFNLELTPEGKLCAWRSSCTEGEAGAKPFQKTYSELLSKENIPVGKWTDVTVVYDMRKLSLYVNGKFQGEVPSPPDRAHEWINPVTIGSLCSFPWTPRDFFAGDIRDIRIYGRNLKQEEFLKK